MKTLKKYIFTSILIGLLLPVSLTQAEDIDLYASSSGAQSNPNILIILDNSSNWSANNQGWPTDTAPPVACGNDCNKQGYYELKALRTLINGLASNYGDASGNVPINVGLVLFNNSNATNDGTYVRSAVKPMSAANRAALIAKLDTIIGNFNTETAASSVQYGAALFDAFKYFGGFTNPANATTDLAPATNPTYSSIPVFGTQFWGSNNKDGSKPDTTAYSGSDYVPIAATSCGRNFIIFIGNGFPAKDDVPSSDMKQVLMDLTNPASPTTAVAQFNIQNYTDTVSTSTSAASCSNVTSAPGNACQSNSACSSNLSNALYASTSTSTSTSSTNTTTGVITTTSITPSTTYSCNSSASGCPSNAKNKIQGCTSTATVTTTSTPNGLPAQPSGNATGRYADEYTNFLYNTDVNSLAGQQNVTTYAIDVYKNARDANQSALMRNMASYGHGKYYAATDLSELSKAFDNILAEIQSVNSVFASSSLPVSVNAQGTYLNQVFMGMFRPDSSSNPRWFGNLKQYQFKFFGGNLKLADFSATPIEAISAVTGFITPCATSAWSTDTGSYWQYNANSVGLCNATTKFSDAPDGNVVEKGGAAQRLRGVTGPGIISTFYEPGTGKRQLKTCASASCTALTDFSTANTSLTYTALGVASDTEKDALINWVRGQDVDNENNTTAFPNTMINEMRPSVHGGVVHSQPAVVDYGGTTGVVSFYGADDGIFHAINGNKTDTDGNEYWGFIAPETYLELSRLKINTQKINFPTVASSLTPTPKAKDYFFDGSIGVFQRASTGNVWIYPTMRRGGRAIYAFDVSTPASPSLKWRNGCFTNSTSDDSNCSGSWSAIGQTWSKPQIAYLSGYVDGASRPKPVLVFGGGYDTCEDADSQTRCTGTRKGANIWFVDADTGSILRTYPTNYSVPGEITLLTDATGYATYAYAADTGGYVYRINIGTYNGTTFSSAWTNNTAAANITIANLSGSGQALKFLFGPDVVAYNGFNAVLIGSGDREHPLITSYACNNFSSGGVQNQFFMLKDIPTAYPSPVITPSNLTNVTTNLTATASDIGANGWRFNLVDPASSASRCEQVVNKALTIGGVTYFGTNGPKSASETSNSCGVNLGNARGYAVNFLSGAPITPVGSTTLNSRYTDYKYGGLPPSPVGGIVDIDGKKVPFCIGCKDQFDGNEPIINPSGPRQRVYWYLETD